MLQVNCGWFFAASWMAEFWNLVLHLSVSSQESLSLNAAMASSPHGPQHLVFRKFDLVLSRMWAAVTHRCRGGSLSSGSLSPLCSQHLSTKASSVDHIPNLILSGKC